MLLYRIFATVFFVNAFSEADHASASPPDRLRLCELSQSLHETSFMRKESHRRAFTTGYNECIA